MSQHSSAGRFLIQIESPGRTLDMAAAKTLLADTGVELEDGYGPILVNPALGRFVVRGRATRDARARAESLPGVKFYSDARVSPMG
jgi:hypothetical protein